MARAMNLDPLMPFRFHVDAIGVNGESKLVVPGRPQAGFTKVTSPSMTVDGATYREGNFVYEQKFPGAAKMEGNITMERGVVRGNTSFWDWMLQVAEGSGEYRADLQIKHYHRDAALTRAGEPPRSADQLAQDNLTQFSLENPARTYLVFNCFPVKHATAGELDATQTSQVSMTTLEVSYEHFLVIENQAP